ncbi:MAG: ABC transporter ATP-binding protein [Candidatus Palauibacterales bacterium]|nr:ABC transporter ATP-binding protein [Candidatus Palauibacterales bacterium]
MISARGLTRRFGSQTILDGLDLEVGPGERVALLGRNGAGKTTFFRCALGLLPFSGDLEVAGVDVRTDGLEARSAIGYVPQRPPHFDGTLEDLVRFFSGLREIPSARVRLGMSELGLSLDEHGRKAVRELSGGMLQKVLLALAVAEAVPVLLLDEPTANLDGEARAEFLRALKRVPDSCTVILSSHRLEDVRAAADRVLVLENGRLAFDGELDALLERSGSSPTVWICTDRTALANLVRLVEDDRRVIRVHRNGVSVGIETLPGNIADILTDVRGEGIPVDDLRVEEPGLGGLFPSSGAAAESSSGAASGEATR